LGFEAEANEARQRGQEYKTEVENLQQELSAVDRRFSSQLKELADQFDQAQHAARHMHVAVCRPDAGLSWCVFDVNL
jgi:flagellar hook-basal body complex protein FliE